MNLPALALTGLLPLLYSYRAAAQSTDAPPPARPRQALKLGLYSSETAGGSYERQLGPRASLQVTAGYWTSGYDGGRGFIYDSTFFYYTFAQRYQVRRHRAALSVQVRRYLQPGKPALVGWYAGVGAELVGRWVHYRYDNGHTEGSFDHAQRLQLRLGRQWQLGSRFTFDLGLGPELAVGTEPRYEYNTAGVYTPTSERYFYARPGFGLALQLGYRF